MLLLLCNFCRGRDLSTCSKCSPPRPPDESLSLSHRVSDCEKGLTFARRRGLEFATHCRLKAVSDRLRLIVRALAWLVRAFFNSRPPPHIAAERLKQIIKTRIRLTYRILKGNLNSNGRNTRKDFIKKVFSLLLVS